MCRSASLGPAWPGGFISLLNGFVAGTSEVSVLVTRMKLSEAARVRGGGGGVVL